MLNCTRSMVATDVENVTPNIFVMMPFGFPAKVSGVPFATFGGATVTGTDRLAVSILIDRAKC